jgi:hypothetical protein
MSKGCEVEFTRLVTGHTRLGEDPFSHGSNVLSSSDLASVRGFRASNRGDLVLASVLRKCCGCRTPSPFVANANWCSGAYLDFCRSAAARINVNAANDNFSARI